MNYEQAMEYIHAVQWAGLEMSFWTFFFVSMERSSF